MPPERSSDCRMRAPSVPASWTVVANSTSSGTRSSWPSASSAAQGVVPPSRAVERARPIRCAAQSGLDLGRGVQRAVDPDTPGQAQDDQVDERPCDDAEVAPPVGRLAHERRHGQGGSRRDGDHHEEAATAAGTGRPAMAASSHRTSGARAHDPVIANSRVANASGSVPVRSRSARTDPIHRWSDQRLRNTCRPAIEPTVATPGLRTRLRRRGRPDAPRSRARRPATGGVGGDRQTTPSTPSPMHDGQHHHGRSSEDHRVAEEADRRGRTGQRDHEGESAGVQGTHHEEDDLTLGAAERGEIGAGE